METTADLDPPRLALARLPSRDTAAGLAGLPSRARHRQMHAWLASKLARSWVGWWMVVMVMVMGVSGEREREWKGLAGWLVARCRGLQSAGPGRQADRQTDRQSHKRHAFYDPGSVCLGHNPLPASSQPKAKPCPARPQ